MVTGSDICRSQQKTARCDQGLVGRAGGFSTVSEAMATELG